jgi:hypothetical protein
MRFQIASVNEEGEEYALSKEFDATGGGPLGIEALVALRTALALLSAYPNDTAVIRVVSQ